MKFFAWEDVDPFEYKVRVQGFDNDQRFQTVAVTDGCIVGYWQFMPYMDRGRIWFASCYTKVAVAQLRRGVASGLWRCGVERWKPSRIEAMVGSWEGSRLLAKMKVVFLVEKGLEVIVKADDGRGPVFDRHLSQAAMRELERRPKRAVAPRVERRLKILQGGAA